MAGAGAPEMASEMDRFGIDFPDAATARMKAVMLAATFLIDFIYFEGDGDLEEEADD